MIERLLVLDPNIQCTVIFGSGRTHNGVIIEPAKECQLDVTDDIEREKFIDQIWWACFPLSPHTLFSAIQRSSVERANEFAPQHSRIFREVCSISCSC